MFTYISHNIVKEHLSVNNSLSKCIEILFNQATAERVTNDYRLGCFSGKDMFDKENLTNATIFWYIDAEGKVRNGKVQEYCTNVHDSEHFAHYDKSNGKIFYMGNRLAKEGKLELPKDADGNPVTKAEFDNECFFGAHLLTKRPNADVMLVESPKNAIFGAAMYPDFVWIAAGSSSVFKANKTAMLAPLLNRRVVVIPDRDMIAEWGAEIGKMHSIATFVLNDFCDNPTIAGDNAKYDIADYIIEQQMQHIPF